VNQQKNLLLSNQQQQTSIEPTSNIDVDVQEVEEVLSTTKK
jgi:hypothetical protein